MAADPGGFVAGNGDLANAHDGASSTITAANVSQLKPAWSFPLTEISAAEAMSSNPIVSDGILYFSDAKRNAYGVFGLGQNGVTLANGRIFMGVAADVVTMYPGDLGGTETPMALSDGTIYVPVMNLCTKIVAQGNYPAGIEICNPGKGRGAVVALDGATGRRRWKHELPTVGDTLYLGAGSPVESGQAPALTAWRLPPAP